MSTSAQKRKKKKLQADRDRWKIVERVPNPPIKCNPVDPFRDRETLDFSDVPEYLREGDFYQEFNEEHEDSTIPFVPLNVRKSNPCVKNDIDLLSLLKSADFALLAKLPWTVFNYCLAAERTRPFSFLQILEDLARVFPSLLILRDVLAVESVNERLELAAQRGGLEILECYVRNGLLRPSPELEVRREVNRKQKRKNPPTPYTFLERRDLELAPIRQMEAKVRAIQGLPLCSLAVLNGHYAVFKFLLNQGFLFKFSDESAYDAVRGGSLDCLKYIAEKYFLQHSDRTVIPKLCELAARHGRLDCLEYAHKAGSVLNQESLRIATAYGHVNCLPYLLENGCVWDKLMMQATAANGHLDCLKFMHENDCPWGNLVCENACFHNQLACLQYARDKGCPWSSTNTCVDICRAKYTPCVAFAHVDSCCPWSHAMCALRTHSGGAPYCLSREDVEQMSRGATNCLNAAANGDLPRLRALFVNSTSTITEADRAALTIAAAKSGTIICLQFLAENECTMTADVCAAAASAGQIGALSYAFEVGGAWDNRVIEGSIRAGDAQCLQYALRLSCPCVADTRVLCGVAARGGRLECLQVLRDYDRLTVSTDMCNQAAEAGQRECLQFLVTCGAAVDKTTYLFAARSGHLSCLQYLHEMQTEWHEHTVLVAAFEGHLKCAEYAFEHGGCETDDLFAFLSDRPEIADEFNEYARFGTTHNDSSYRKSVQKGYAFVSKITGIRKFGGRHS